MSDILSTLKYDFGLLVKELVESCRRRGVLIRPYYTLRTPLQQAKLWRQSRSAMEISRAIKAFHGAGCDFLGDTLQNAGPQKGKWATNALPGYSWHNWGYAVDCFVVKDGAFVQRGDDPLYELYASEAISLGLTAGYYFSHQDSGHVQMYSEEVPEKYTSQEINDAMKKQFGDA